MTRVVFPGYSARKKRVAPERDPRTRVLTLRGEVAPDRRAADLPVVTRNRKSEHAHWSKTGGMTRRQRDDTTMMLRALWGTPPAWPTYRVSITRVAPSPRPLDDDNIRFAASGVRDAIAAYLGVDDGDARYAWVYGQEKSVGRLYGVRIVVTPA